MARPQGQVRVWTQLPKTELARRTVKASTENNFGPLKLYIKRRKTKDKMFDINETDNNGLTALFFAVAYDRIEAVKLLVKHGADVDVVDGEGNTPVFLASGIDQPKVEIVRYLVEECGARVGMQTKDGHTALHGAALQGNQEIVKLLLDNGADPRQPDNGGMFPLDIAQGEETKALIHKDLRHADSALEKRGIGCSCCGKHPATGLKRCGQCHVTLYCSRDCQIQDWKEGGHKKGCVGFMVVTVDRPVTITNSGIMNPNPHARTRTMTPEDVGKAAHVLGKKTFVVKIQVPLGLFSFMAQGMFVYNEDRSVMGEIKSETKGYDELYQRIVTEGVKGYKGFFWGQLSDEPDKYFKVYHGKFAPTQEW